MMGQEKNKYYYISLAKEIADTYTLVDRIAKDEWFDSSVKIVRCNPEYSAISTQILNHKLSFKNDNELFETIDLEIPYPIMSQVWNQDKQDYELFDRYIQEWIKKNAYRESKYLFMETSLSEIRSYVKLKLSLKQKLPPSQYKFSTLYLLENNVFQPDYYIQRLTSEQLPLFEWENSENPNWNY